ncbi:NIF3-like protein 1 [Fulvia fulva]|uniref:NIF3-like protein 1 n=1 Tax=Passalora fulva TaxID=5499 RepID=A0A9Q8UTK8_PASFU|nr:NIF3-like protein 1 [Fulvia fulva]KAK4613242.1 NIF3-like protein 1 [Fulvia fulva]KAK4614368.1 NIF3-like protein 1 [Fulvia fulva]UJO21923.1 NIF3-like protein 1 [Fulvia fulva]WPV20549.1 NIF3-like protein 1 [Fulvia fulva]WPV34854.1 NIF3-like protein 1 [Fulvia fulva]
MFAPTARRLYSKMSYPAVSAPYSRAVVNAMRKLYPEALADKSFDNTGLMLEAPFDPLRRQMNSVLLTVDLTKAVADEAIERQDSIVIAYHPIIFRGLKSLTLQDTQQQSLLRLAAEGISVYSPHTAVDCARGGLGDWLADIVTGTPTDPSELDDGNVSAQHSPEKGQTPAETSNDSSEKSSLLAPKRPVYMLRHHPSQLDTNDRALKLNSGGHKRYPITKPGVEGYPGAGMGRIIRFAEPVPLTEIIDRIGLGLGNPKGFPIAVPQGKQASDMQISSIALCAGSGGGLFSQAEKNGEEADLYFTGELSHHEALAAIEKGKCVITLFHSNTERGFLHGVLKQQLERQITEEWEKLRAEETAKDWGSEDLKEAFKEALEDGQVEVFVSEVDRDPYGIMISKDEI